MSESQSRAQRWLNSSVSRRVRELRLSALWHCVVGLIACGVWWISVVGTLYAFWFILAFAGIRIPAPWAIGLGIYAFQFGLFRLVRRKPQAQWEVSEDIDGNVVVVPPDHSQTSNYIYNQDHDFSFRKVYVGIFFAGPIAFDEARRAWKQASWIKRLDRDPLAQLASILFDEQKKLTFAEIRQGWLGDGYKKAILQAAELPGFQMFSHDPQGVALTDDAISGLLEE